MQNYSLVTLDFFHFKLTKIAYQKQILKRRIFLREDFYKSLKMNSRG